MLNWPKGWGFPADGTELLRERYEDRGQTRAHRRVESLATASIRDRTWSFS